MATYGLFSDAVLSYVVGKVGKKIGRIPFFVFSMVVDFGSYAYCLWWDPRISMVNLYNIFCLRSNGWNMANIDKWRNNTNYCILNISKEVTMLQLQAAFYGQPWAMLYNLGGVQSSVYTLKFISRSEC
uniref:uncharacterized protein LOC120345202 n=1 Tax=Styela clava TaxID=7725 RepID=UPI00193A5548|nr:uncharacterized protein LOC120345202 [Styela clava]